MNKKIFIVLEILLYFIVWFLIAYFSYKPDVANIPRPIGYPALSKNMEIFGSFLASSYLFLPLLATIVLLTINPKSTKAVNLLLKISGLMLLIGLVSSLMYAYSFEIHPPSNNVLLGLSPFIYVTLFLNGIIFLIIGLFKKIKYRNS